MGKYVVEQKQLQNALEVGLVFVMLKDLRMNVLLFSSNGRGRIGQRNSKAENL
jgi:hypothetical protein